MVLNIRNSAVGARYIAKMTPRIQLDCARPGSGLEAAVPMHNVVGALPDGLSSDPEPGFWVRCRPNSDQCGHKSVIMFIFLYEQLYLSIFIRLVPEWY